MDTGLDQVRTRHHARSVTVVSLLAALGMLFGYARDAGLAAVFGASSATDAFFVASIIPIILGTVVMGGALSPALIPILSQFVEEPAKAWRIVNALLTLSILALAALMLALTLGAGTVVGWLAPGFDLQRSSQTVRLVILTVPLIGLLGLSALLGAVLNAFNNFHMPALAVPLVNATAFGAVLVFAPRWGIEAVALGMVIGGILQLALLIFALLKLGWRYQPLLDLGNPALHEVLKLFGPVLGFMILAQCVPLLERILGSGFASGQLSWLTYAGKLYQIPNLAISQSITVVLFPALARAAVPGDRTAFTETLRSGLRMILFLTVPVTLWFFAAAPMWTRLAFQRGAFTILDMQETARLLSLYSLAIVPNGMSFLLARTFQSQRDVITPLAIGIVNILIYTVAAILLSQSFGLDGLPLAFFLSQCATLILSLGLLVRKTAGLGRLLDGNLARIAIIGVLLAASLFIWARVLEPRLADSSLASQITVFVISVVTSILVYWGVAFQLGVPEARTFAGLIPLQRLSSHNER